MLGDILALTANGDDPKTGIFWVAMPLDDNANHRVVHGVLRAYDASNFANRPGAGTGVPKQLVQIWSSDHDNNQTNDSLGMFAKFTPPTVANGKVFVATFQEENPAPGMGSQVHTVNLRRARAVRQEHDRPGYLAGSRDQGRRRSRLARRVLEVLTICCLGEQMLRAKSPAIIRAGSRLHMGFLLLLVCLPASSAWADLEITASQENKAATDPLAWIPMQKKRLTFSQ
jgi:hypothetical protein